MMIFGTIGKLVVLYLLLRNDAFGKRHTTSDTGDDALTILKRPYANGELDAETFERMKRELRWLPVVVNRPIWHTALRINTIHK